MRRRSPPPGSLRGRDVRRPSKPRDATPVIIAVALFVLSGAIAAAAIALPKLLDTAQEGLSIQSFATLTPAPLTPGPTGQSATPTAAGLPALNGSPLSLSDLKRAWEGKGLSVSGGRGVGGFSGFQVTPAEVVLSKGGDSMAAAVLVYPDASAIKRDWRLAASSGPAPELGRELPDHVSMWWNANVVVVVRTGTGAVVSEAKEAFLALG